MFICSIFITIFLFAYIYSSYLEMQPDTRILEGYYKVDDYSDSHLARDYADFYKYYYTSADDCKFESEEMYEKVKTEDIERIKSYFVGMTRNYERLNGYNFGDDIVDENDYFIVGYDKGSDVDAIYHVFFYDTDSHILYEADVRN